MRGATYDAWRKLGAQVSSKQPTIPYDFDLKWHDGCFGSDILFDDPPLVIFAEGNTLYFRETGEQSSFITVTPELMMLKSGYDYCYRRDEHVLELRKTVSDLLNCGIAANSDDNVKTQLRSALWMMRGAARFPEEQDGPYSFRDIHLNFRFRDADITINAQPLENSWEVGALSVSVDPDGFSASYGFTVNRAGLIYEKECFGGYRDMPCNPVYDMRVMDRTDVTMTNRELGIDEKGRTEFVLEALSSYVNGKGAHSDEVKKIIKIVKNTEWPEWVHK